MLTLTKPSSLTVVCTLHYGTQCPFAESWWLTGWQTYISSHDGAKSVFDSGCSCYTSWMASDLFPSRHVRCTSTGELVQNDSMPFWWASSRVLFLHINLFHLWFFCYDKSTFLQWLRYFTLFHQTRTTNKGVLYLHFQIWIQRTKSSSIRFYLLVNLSRSVFISSQVLPTY